MLACAWTVSSHETEDDLGSGSQVVNREALIEVLASTLEAIDRAKGSKSSRVFVADGIRLATIRALHLLDSAELAGFHVGIQLYDLLAGSPARDDMTVYLLDGQCLEGDRDPAVHSKPTDLARCSSIELTDPQIDALVQHLELNDSAAQSAISPGQSNSGTSDLYFNSIWENITTRINEDPYEKTSLENSDPLNVAAFNPTYSWENATKLPIDLSSIMRRPPTERDLDTGTSMLPLFMRSRMYDLYDPYATLETQNEKNRESAEQASKEAPAGRFMKSISHGTGNDPIEIDDSPPSLTQQSQTSSNNNSKAKKRPYPQESPVKVANKKAERKGSSSSGKTIAPLRKGKTKKE